MACGNVTFEYEIPVNDKELFLHVQQSDSSPTVYVSFLQIRNYLVYIGGSGLPKALSFKLSSGKNSISAFQLLISPLTNIKFQFPSKLSVKRFQQEGL